MNLRLVGLLVTAAAVFVLLGSMVAGLGGASPDVPPTLSAPRTIPEALPAGRVEVLNGAGIPGIAREITERLRARGFDVKYYGNAGGPIRDSTVVLYRGGDSIAARRVAESLRVNRIETAIDTTLYLDATVILGADWPAIDRQE